MIIGLDKIIKLLTGILITIILLGICISIDSADEIINNSNVDSQTNDTYVNLQNNKTSEVVGSSKDTVNYVHPEVTIISKPSCGCRYGYYWHNTTFINYCPHCHKYGTLQNVHKWQARYEQELTCDTRLGGCGADYCGCCGKEKYSWSNYYLQKPHEWK